MINLEKKTREIESINFVAFSNNVVVVNTTPHPVTGHGWYTNHRAYFCADQCQGRRAKSF